MADHQDEYQDPHFVSMRRVRPRSKKHRLTCRCGWGGIFPTAAAAIQGLTLHKALTEPGEEDSDD